MHILSTQAHSETQKFLKKYRLLIRKNATTSKITNTVTLVISIVLFVLVYPEANISAFFFLSNVCGGDEGWSSEEAWTKREASSGYSDENSAEGPMDTNKVLVV